MLNKEMRVFSVQKASWIAAVMLFLFIPPYFMWGLLSNNVFRIIFSIKSILPYPFFVFLGLTGKNKYL